MPQDKGVDFPVRPDEPLTGMAYYTPPPPQPLPPDPAPGGGAQELRTDAGTLRLPPNALEGVSEEDQAAIAAALAEMEAEARSGRQAPPGTAPSPVHKECVSH